MYDIELAREILKQIYHATELILKRFESVQNVSDFTNSPAGMVKLKVLCIVSEYQFLCTGFTG